MADDLDILKKRILERDRRVPVPSTVETLRKTMTPDGAWPDVDYADQSRSAWTPPRHLSRLTDLAQAFAAGDETVKKSLFRALDYWFLQDPQNPNWWWNVIGVPRTLANNLLLLDDHLTPAQRAKGIEILTRGKLGMTGQNLVWVAEITAKRGILTRDANLVSEAYARMAEEICITTKEGIQPDFSFHQHGALLYNHGYGAGFASDCTQIASLVAGTRFAFSQEKIDILTAYVLDGSQWMLRGQMPDYSAKGREITRKGPSARYLIGACDHLLSLSSTRKPELQALKHSLEQRTAPPVSGNKHFWRSDIMCHHRPSYYASARMFSTRILSTDGPANSEGLKSHHLSDGCNYLFLRGDEYEGIFPVWDWQKIPGTTIAQTGEFPGKPNIFGEKSFVGGTSNGAYGLAAFDLKRDSLTARKSWFFFDREYVCLGAGISATCEVPVFTTLNQCLLRGPVTVSGLAVPEGDRAIPQAQWVHHNGVAYCFLEPGNLHMRNAPQAGNWWEITHSYGQEPLAMDVFTLWIDHGIHPQNATYAYLVAPDMQVGDVPQYTAAHGVHILCNTPALQAVHHNDQHITGMAFYEPGICDIAPGLAVTVDHPCLVLLCDKTLSVSNPENEPLTVAVTLTSKRRTQTHRIALPGGFEAGSTVTLTR